jgi:DNA-binding NarL/FixJ family response regulator
VASIVTLARAVARSTLIEVGRRVSRHELLLARSRPNAIATLLLVRWYLDDTGARAENARERLIEDMRKLNSIGRSTLLTQREWEVLVAAALGFTRAETGELLGVGDETVKSIRASACARLAATNVTHAVAIAIRRGLL